jgi:hypothetical protein
LRLLREIEYGQTDVVQTVKNAFGAYAKCMGMADSELARLLIAREQRHRQLATFIANGGRVRPSIARSPEPPKITAHFSSEAAASDFDNYAASFALTRDRAAGWILERELEERWLETAFSQRPTPSGP